MNFQEAIEQARKVDKCVKHMYHSIECTGRLKAGNREKIWGLAIPRNADYYSYANIQSRRHLAKSKKSDVILVIVEFKHSDKTYTYQALAQDGLQVGDYVNVFTQTSIAVTQIVKLVSIKDEHVELSEEFTNLKEIKWIIGKVDLTNYILRNTTDIR